jgi:hypothetical protein
MEPELPHFRGSMITRTHATVSRTPLDNGSAQLRGFWSFMPLAGFEAAIPARLQARALDRAATGIGRSTYLFLIFLTLKRG